MSTDEVSEKTRQALKSVRELLEKAEQTARKELTKAAPAVQKSLDASLEAAANGFNATMKTVDSRTEQEQLGLLKGYRKFLAGQIEFVDSRIRSIEGRAPSKKQ